MEGWGPGLQGDRDGKWLSHGESACSAGAAGDVGSITGLGRSPGGGDGHPVQNACLGKFHGQRSLAGDSPWGCKDLDMT